ncbi:MAG: exonuclease subunit SbcD, partial [Deltaproteobacteria bacterium]|nr:exonuclease subunit SbcD [Deltaproteobacteria bacterium]
MRILHTSDWHLGVSTGAASRAAEQQWFLEWLLDTLEVRQVDTLVVAGDVFDAMHPSAEAQALYYRFLARVEGAGVRDVVVVGGNHDSPSHLDAPRALLETVDVHVVGGVPATDDRLDRMIAPLRARGSDEVTAVCLAVPYVHEYRLGIRTSDLDVDQTRAAFKTAFADLYGALADRAVERCGDLPLVATGHLTMGFGATRADYPQEIHQVGTIEGLPVEILDPRIRYAALGHIHRCYPIDGSTAWYCGTPIPYALSEMAVARQVLVVDLDGQAEARVERVEVPRSRDLVQLVGTPEEVLAELGGLRWSTRLPPLVHVRVETSMAEPGLVRRLHEAIASHADEARPVLVEVQQRASDVEIDAPAPFAQSLDALEPEDV